MFRNVLIASTIGLLFATSSYATPVNVAEGAAVTLNGVYGSLRAGSPWATNPVAAASSLTDGVFLPAATVWNDGSVWWDEDVPESADNSIEIDLGGVYELIGFIVQADDNDAYLIEYWNGVGWANAWDVPIAGGFGLQARPNAADNTDIFLLASSISTDRLRFSATAGDNYFSISEIQAFTVPEPGTLALLGIGLFGMGLARRRQAV